MEHGFKDVLDEYGEGEIPITELIDKLMRNTVKDDISMLPGIYGPEFEYELSSVFVNPVSPKVTIFPNFLILFHFVKGADVALTWENILGLYPCGCHVNSRLVFQDLNIYIFDSECW